MLIPCQGHPEGWLSSCMVRTCSHHPCRTCFRIQPNADGSCAGSTQADPCTSIRRTRLSTKPARRWFPWWWWQLYFPERIHMDQTVSSWRSQRATDVPKTGPTVLSRKQYLKQFQEQTQWSQSSDERRLRQRSDYHHLASPFFLTNRPNSSNHFIFSSSCHRLTCPDSRRN